MGSGRSCTKLHAATLTLLACCLRLWHPQWLVFANVHHQPQPRLGSMPLGTTHRKRSVTCRGYQGFSASERVDQDIEVDAATMDARVKLVQIMKQNPIPGLAAGLGLDWDTSNWDGIAGMDVHEGVLLYTGVGNVLIDRVSEIGEGTSRVRVRMFRGVATTSTWKATGRLAGVTPDVTVRDLWEATLPDQQDVLMGGKSNNCQDTANRVLAAATGEKFNRSSVPAAYAGLFATKWMQPWAINVDERLLRELRQTAGKDVLPESFLKVLKSSSVSALKSFTGVFYDASLAVLAHASTLASEVETLACNRDVLANLTWTLKQDVIAAHDCIEEAKRIPSAEALQEAFGATSRVCYTADVLLSALQMLDKGVGAQQKQADMGMYASMALYGVSVLVLASLSVGVVPVIARAASLPVAFVGGELIQAASAGACAGFAGSIINDETRSKLASLRKSATACTQEIRKEVEKLMTALAECFLHMPELFDGFCEGIASFSPQDRKVFQVVFVTLMQQMRANLHKALSFLMGVNDRSRYILVAENVIDDAFADQILHDMRMDSDMPLQDQASYLLRLDKYDFWIKQADLEQTKLLEGGGVNKNLLKDIGAGADAVSLGRTRNMSKISYLEWKVRVALVVRGSLDFLAHAKEYFNEHFMDANPALAAEGHLAKYQELQRFKQEVTMQKQMYGELFEMLDQKQVE